MQYADALELLQSGRHGTRVLKSKLRTTLEKNGDIVFMRLVDTPIIEWRPNGDIQLSSGGWRTVTTKARFNEYLPTPWYVYQEDRAWFVHWGSWDNGKAWAFADNMILHMDGTVTGAASAEEIGAQKDLESGIKRYAKGFVKDLFSGKVGKPSAGDCFYCVMRDSDGKTLGDLCGDGEHLRSHIQESYYVPSLLYNAVEEGKVSPMAKWTIQELWDKTHEPDRMDGFIGTQIRKAIETYMRRRLGLA